MSILENRVFIIAEAGDNHNGDINLAYKLVDVAVEAGADCVKFQTFITEEIISKKAEMAEYQKKNTGISESQFEMVKKLELSFDDFKKIKAYCDQKGIIFLSTAFDLPSVKFLNQIQIPFWKIPSGEITNLPYLEAIAKTGKKIVMSTGMASLKEIEAALNILKVNGAKDIVLLHCNTEYPTPMEDVNLLAMIQMRNLFNCEVGYSDHTQGIEVPIAAVTLGARIIEKHFTLDKNMPGPDHKASLEPEELKLMVTSIRNIEKALGDGIKKVSKSEKKNIEIARKSITAKKMIKKGETFSIDNITCKRPGNGISPMEWYNVLGQKAMKDFKEDELILL